jgi:hypothetical protein
VKDRAPLLIPPGGAAIHAGFASGLHAARALIATNLGFTIGASI